MNPALGLIAGFSPAPKAAAGAAAAPAAASEPAGLETLFADLLTALTADEALPPGSAHAGPADALASADADAEDSLWTGALPAVDILMPTEGLEPEVVMAAPEGAIPLIIRLESEGRQSNALQDAIARQVPGRDALASAAALAAPESPALPAIDAAAATLREALPGSFARTPSPAAGAMDAGGTYALTGSAQPAAAEQQLASAAGRQAQPAPLSPQDLRATVTQTFEQVSWMSKEGVHQARLQLEPAHLGRLDIWLDIEAGEARLHLGAQQAQVREALESVLPRLRDALAEQGLTLTDASVSHSGRDDLPSGDQRGKAAAQGALAGEEDVAGDEPALASQNLSTPGLVDIYA